jgi:dipeptidyl aminopeptidase/acylaminoacyl peptidase
VYHSDDDGAAAASTKMCEAIKAAGAACELFVSHGLGHGLGKWKDVPAEHERLVAWLRRTLRAQ